MTETVTSPSPTFDPTALLAGELTPQKLERFKAAVFQSVNTVESLRDWLQSPMASGEANSTAQSPSEIVMARRRFTSIRLPSRWRAQS